MLAASGWLWQRERARRPWHEARAALRRHDLRAALSSLEQYLRLRPDDPAGWFLAGRTARRLGRVAEATRYLERYQQLAGVTDASRLEWDLMRVQQGDVGETDVRLRMSVGPDHPDALLVLEALARGYVRAERLVEARQACELWMRREPDHPWPWLWRGWTSERLHHSDGAVADYRRAVELAPDDPEARLALARVLTLQRKPGPAAEQFERVLARSPEDDEALLGLAACRVEQGRSPEAVPLIERALAHKPSSQRGLFLRGKVAFQAGELGRAEGLLRRAVGLAPDDAEALHTLVQCLGARHQKAEAAALAAKLEQLKKDLRRLDELVRAVAAKPNEAGARQQAGVLALKVGRTEEGLRWLHSALRARGDHRPAHAALAEYYSARGDRERAEAHRRLAQTP